MPPPRHVLHRTNRTREGLRPTFFQSLDFVYIPTEDVAGTADRYVATFGAKLNWRVSGMGTTVACLSLSDAGPDLLLSGHLEGSVPILVYRVDDYDAAVREVNSAGIALRELEIPHGPCASFTMPGGQRLAIYELTRREAARHFAGRFDKPGDQQ